LRYLLAEAKTIQRWRCRECEYRFSSDSFGKPFEKGRASHKMSLNVHASILVLPKSGLYVWFTRFGQSHFSFHLVTWDLMRMNVIASAAMTAMFVYIPGVCWLIIA